MYDIKPLEEEWEKYRKKRSKPIYVFAFLSFIVLIGIIIFFNTDKFLADQKKVIVKSMENNVSSKVTKFDEAHTDTPKTKIEKNKKVKILVSNKEEVPMPSIVENIPILEEIEHKKVSNVQIEKPRKKMYLDIVESSSLSAYKEVEKRFYKSRDIDDSLFLAKSYYSKGKYKKSEYWALQTNKINSNIDDSWIIFAQSKMKQGDKNDAVSILTNYVKRTGSEKAKNILNQLKNK